MKSAGKGSGMVGYNAQCAVDTKHHLIVTHEVTNIGNDRGHLCDMAQNARRAMAVQELGAIADRGYFSGQELLACERLGITAYVPRTMTSDNKKKGLIDKSDFVYESEYDRYRCPAGEQLPWRFATDEGGLTMHVYWASDPTCRQCAMKSRCTKSSQPRRVRRWEHEDVVDAVQARVDEAPEMMQIRRQTVEHPFGTLKAWMGATHFLTKTLVRVRAEMSLQVLAYNMKRMINLLGVRVMMEAVRAA